MTTTQLDVRNTALLTAVYGQSWPAPDPNHTPRKGFLGTHSVKSSIRSTQHQPHHQPTSFNGRRPPASRPPSSSSSTTSSAVAIRQRRSPTTHHHTPHHHTPHHHTPHHLNPHHHTPGQQGGSGVGSKGVYRHPQGSGHAPHHPGQELYINGRNAKDGWEARERNDGVVRTTDLPLRLGLDKGTLQWKSWSSFKQDLETNNDEDELSLYKLTQDTFRKLTQQVTEASQRFTSKYGSPGFQNVRRSQLASSLPSSHPSIQNHKESEGGMDEFQASLAIQCTQFKTTARKRPKSHLVTSRRSKLQPPPRPHSSMGGVSDTSMDRYDTLSPSIINQLGEDIANSEERGGEANLNLGPFDIVKDDYKLSEGESDAESLDEQTIPTDGLEDDNEEDSDDSHRFAAMAMDSSEDEEDVQERLERMRRRREKLQKKMMRLDLPPELLSGDLDCMFPYSGSTESKKKKQELFPSALSEPYCHMDLLELSTLDKDWRTIIRTAPDHDDAVLMERMIEMEKLQYETAEWEKGLNAPKRRVQSALQTRKGWNADAAIPTERAHSALSRPKQSKNCCEDCMQLVCAGDCPAKVAASYNSCVHCRQAYCNGACTEFGYHLHIRYARQEEKKKRRPKSCHTCRRSKTPNNIINTNNIILGRPRSGFATYSSSRVQSAKSRKMTVASTEGAEHVSNRMEELSLTARKYEDKTSDGGEMAGDGEEEGGKKQRPRTAKSRRQVRGRDAMISGKSFQSQRRFSLTEDPVTTTAASMNPKVLRVRSAHYRTRKARQKAKRAKKK